MRRRLRTVAWFDVAYKADILKAALQDAGIEAQVVDREIVSMEWLLANAVNGVKLQVAEEDEARAMAILDELYRSGFDQLRVSDEELERQAMEATDPEAVEELPVPDQTTSHAVATDAPADPLTVDRDKYARRFMLCSVFSLVFPPLVIYACYLGLIAVFGSGQMSSVGWQRVGFGVTFGGILISLLLWMVTFLF